MKILGNRVLILPVPEPEPASVIVAPETSKEPSHHGLVVLRGNGPDIPPELTPGTRVYVSRGFGHGYALVEYQGVEHHIVSMLDVEMALP